MKPQALSFALSLCAITILVGMDTNDINNNDLQMFSFVPIINEGTKNNYTQGLNNLNSVQYYTEQAEELERHQNGLAYVRIAIMIDETLMTLSQKYETTRDLLTNKNREIFHQDRIDYLEKELNTTAENSELKENIDLFIKEKTNFDSKSTLIKNIYSGVEIILKEDKPSASEPDSYKTYDWGHQALLNLLQQEFPREIVYKYIKDLLLEKIDAK